MSSYRIVIQLMTSPSTHPGGPQGHPCHDVRKLVVCRNRGFMYKATSRGGRADESEADRSPSACGCVPPIIDDLGTLSMRHIPKAFAGQSALDDVSLTVRGDSGACRDKRIRQVDLMKILADCPRRAPRPQVLLPKYIAEYKSFVPCRVKSSVRVAPLSYLLWPCALLRASGS
jgi:hypothetical protein